MKNIIIIAKKEWSGYFRNGVGFVFAGLLLLITNWMFLSDLFLTQQADIRPYFGVLVFLLSIFVPAITMGLIAEEKKNGNWEVILSLPVSEMEMVLGKFVGCSWYVLYTVALSLPMIATLWWLGRPDIGATVGSLVGTGLLGLSYVSVGLLMSSLSKQPIVGFLGAAVLLLVNNLMSQEAVLSKVPLGIRGIVEALSLSWRMERFGGGLIELSDIVFYLSWMIIFLMLTVMVLKNRNK